MRGISPGRRQVLALLLAALMVVSAVPGPIGTATASHKCSTSADEDVLSLFMSPNPIASLGGAGGIAAGEYVTCELWSTHDVDDVTELNVYKDALDQQANEEVYTTSVDNTLQDSETVALVKGKNAYIRSLNNGSSQSAANADAKKGASDYYSRKQVELITSWNQSVSQVEYLENITDNSSSINEEFHSVSVTDQDSTVQSVTIVGFGTTSLTLTNSTTHNARSVTINITTSSGNPDWETTVTPTTGSFNTSQGTYSWVESDGFRVKSPSSVSDPPVTYLKNQRYADAWTAMGSHKSNVSAELSDFVNLTYSDYHQGEINNSELIDPYVLSSEYDPGDDFQSWALATAATTGVSGPEDFSGFGSMEVTNVSDSGNESYEGILMSETNPSSGEFAANSTYNASQIDGQQYVATSSNLVELKGEFVTGNMTNAGGEKIQNVTIQRVNYSSANISGYQQALQNLSQLRNEIASRSNAGGLFGGLNIPSGPLAKGAAIAAAGGVAAYGLGLIGGGGAGGAAGGATGGASGGLLSQAMRRRRRF